MGNTKELKNYRKNTKIFRIFICENNRKIKKIMHRIELFFFWVVVLMIWAFFTYFIYLSVMGRYNPPPHQNEVEIHEKCPYLQSYQFKKNQHSA